MDLPISVLREEVPEANEGNMTKVLSTRATKALAILEKDGEFRRRLESKGNRRAQFEYALLNSEGEKQYGFGLAVFDELYKAGRLVNLGTGTSVSGYYGLKGE